MTAIRNIAIAAALAVAPLAAHAGDFSTKLCAACHKIDVDSIGPSWKSVADAYGSADGLAKVFKDGFKVEERKIAASNPKFKAQAAIMTAQYNTLIKGKEDDAAAALYAAVKTDKIGQ